MSPELWSAIEDDRLRALVNKYKAPNPVDWAQVALQMEGRSIAALRLRTNRIGVELGLRFSKPVLPRKRCPVCDSEMRKPASSKVPKTCSSPCGAVVAQQTTPNSQRPRPEWTPERAAASSARAKAWIKKKGHPRGFAGRKHSPETLAILADRSRDMWKRWTPEQREANLTALRAEQMKLMAAGPRETRHSRGVGGKRADLDGQYFRSSWEANYARYLNWLIKVGEIKAWEFEPRTFEFPVKRGNRFYTPDFLVTEKDGSQAWHEVKGWLTADGATKLKRFAKYYPQEKLVLIDETQYTSIANQIGKSLPNWEVKVRL